MVTKMAPLYANLFMDRFERDILAQEPILPLVWKRYIDDILYIWTGIRSELDSFLYRLNKAQRTLRLKRSISNERIKFLDLNIFKAGKFLGWEEEKCRYRKVLVVLKCVLMSRWFVVLSIKGMKQSGSYVPILMHALTRYI